jgi:sulfopyruvate decarboxylase subunit beta
VPEVTATDSVEGFKEAVGEALRRDELSCVVAKVEAVGPTSFHMDVGLLENRFEFARYFKSLGDPPQRGGDGP